MTMGTPILGEKRSAAIMQPYFLPYIGYFQLIAAVDVFVVYDNIKYTKKGWINRNRMLLNGQDEMFSLPLKKASDACLVAEREIADDYDAGKLLNKFKGVYARAPYFAQTLPLLEKILYYEDRNLFRYIYHSIVCVCAHLKIATPIRIASEIGIDHALRSQDKVIALCRAVDAQSYINPIGGVELYAKGDFMAQGIELSFLRALPFEYPQFGAPHVPWLSIVDVLMFCAPEQVARTIRDGYELV